MTQVGSATVSMAAVASAGRWSGDLALYRSKDKPAGSLSVAITMLPETAAPMMSGGPPVVTATVMGSGPPPPAMMMPGMQQQQPVAATVISSAAPSAPYGGAAAYGAAAPPPYQQQQQPPAPYGYQAQQGYTPTGAVPIVAATAVGAYGAQQMYGHQQGVVPMYHEDDKKKKKKDKKDKKDKK
ncbi:Serine/threonine-protein phosphatase 2B catalytic subunit alpha, partial [Perkinsus olseni]